MNKRNSIIKFCYVPLLLVVIALCSCTQESIDNNNVSDDDIVKVEASIEGLQSSRAVRLNATNLSQFGVFAFFNTLPKARNIIYKRENSAWVGDRTMTWASGAMNFYGMSPSFDISTVDYNTSMTSVPRHIEYTTPTNADKQIDIMFSSIYNLKKTDNNGKMKFSFKPAMHYVGFNGTNSLSTDYQVFVKTLIVHNLINSGTFSFDATYANMATWTIASNADAVYVNDTINLNEITELTSVRKSLLNNEYLILIPQSTTEWGTTNESPIPIVTADANHNYYVEVVGQIIKTEADGSKKYVLGNVDNSDPAIPQYESVYFPQAARTFRMGAGSTLPILFNGGYNKDGETYLDHTDRGGDVVVKVAEWEPSDFYIEEWTPYYENIEL